ncbi:unnamed protein product [Nesidiocoris tenuis]|uniref:DH domain-containing protein n=1 Tax=Nesidiocoris tenuis TaxID=355587 RepID=A0A6H5H8F2_9HEMI|nr:unnamed protein product [Nesidiocoris tenuis]
METSEESPKNGVAVGDSTLPQIADKKCRTASPKRGKGSFKTPTRLNIVRRSLRMKTSSVLTKWISNLDVSLGSKQEILPQPPQSASTSVPPDHPDSSSHTDMKEDCGMNKLVVDESTTSSAPTQAPSKAYIVKAEWFWASVQNEACVDEKEHIFQETVGRLTPRVSIGSTPGSTRMTSRKRKRLASRLLSAGGAGLLASGGAVGTPVSPSLEAQLKRRSSVSDSTLLSCSGSFLDATPHSELDEGELRIQFMDFKMCAYVFSGKAECSTGIGTIVHFKALFLSLFVPETETECAETPKKNLSARHQVFLELLQTESNYVGILNTIMTVRRILRFHADQNKPNSNVQPYLLDFPAVIQGRLGRHDGRRGSAIERDRASNHLRQPSANLPSPLPDVGNVEARFTKLDRGGLHREDIFEIREWPESICWNSPIGKSPSLQCVFAFSGARLRKSVSAVC